MKIRRGDGGERKAETNLFFTHRLAEALSQLLDLLHHFRVFSSSFNQTMSFSVKPSSTNCLIYLLLLFLLQNVSHLMIVNCCCCCCCQLRSTCLFYKSRCDHFGSDPKWSHLPNDNRVLFIYLWISIINAF